MEFALFQLLSQVDPVLDRVEIGRTIVGVLPEAGTLVAGAFTNVSYGKMLDNCVHVELGTYTFQQRR
jgi:hypothetical protein